MRTVILAFTVAMLGLGCGARTKSGACKDYRPIDFCHDEYVYVCDTTGDGCKQCGCVPSEDADYYGGED